MKRLSGISDVAFILLALACAGQESPVDVDPRNPPVITGVMPATASPGDVVTITGRNFGNDRSRVSVTLGSAHEGEVLFLASTNMDVRIPQDASGHLQIILSVGGLIAIGPSIVVI